MAKNKEDAEVIQHFQPPPAKPSLSDTNARDNFIGIALREIVANQIAEKKWNHDMAAALAVRYANAVMTARATEAAPLNLVMAKSTVTATPVPTTPPPPAPVEGERAKTIAEIIGDAEPVAEVK